MINDKVLALYPALMINENYYSRKLIQPVKFKEIRDRRIKLKAKKDPRQKPLKIVINSAYGIIKDRNNACYDPLMSNNVCIAGQLYLTELAVNIKDKCEILQLNTDGIYVRVGKESDIEIITNIAHEWENRTNLDLEIEVFKKGKLIQKDVNNYILLNKETGKYKSKGAYVKALSSIDNDLPIINKALIEYFVNDVPVETTINNCNKLIDFQKIIKLSNKYNDVVYGDTPLREKVHRVFASTRNDDKGIYKVKSSTYEKIANTPDKCFIDNEDVRKKPIPEYLDKQYYIDLAKERIEQFMTPDKVTCDNTPDKLFECMNNANDYFEFLTNCKNEKITRKQLEPYLIANCCNVYDNNISKLLYIYDYHKMLYGKDKLTISTLNKKLANNKITKSDYEIILSNSKVNKTGKSLIEIDYIEILNQIYDLLEITNVPVYKILKSQWETLGCINYTDEKVNENEYVVLNWRNTIKPTAILYQIKTGNIHYQHFNKSTFNILPLQDCDVIRIKKTETRYKNYIFDKNENGIAIWGEDKNKPYDCVTQYEILDRDYTIKKVKTAYTDYSDMD